MCTREEYVYAARLAEKADRYGDTFEAMKKVAQLNVELTEEESGERNIVGSMRFAIRVLSSIEKKESNSGNERKVEIIKKYEEKLKKELCDFCNDTLQILDKNLIPNTSNAENMVFYYRIKGDQLRHMVEVGVEERKEDTLKAYQQGYKIAEEKLWKSNAIRLALVLNFSVFYYELLDESEACEFAKREFDAAMSVIAICSKDYRDATAILQIMLDNLALWNINSLMWEFQRIIWIAKLL